jgi:hypothetical protein
MSPCRTTSHLFLACAAAVTLAPGPSPWMAAGGRAASAGAGWHRRRRLKLTTSAGASGAVRCSRRGAGAGRAGRSHFTLAGLGCAHQGLATPLRVGDGADDPAGDAGSMHFHAGSAFRSALAASATTIKSRPSGTGVASRDRPCGSIVSRNAKAKRAGVTGSS